MSARELREEVETQIMLGHRDPRHICMTMMMMFPILGIEALVAIGELKAQGRVLERDGKLYLQRSDEEERTTHEQI